ncbi:MAG: efflux transporter outer membrane subunit [Candidatus Gastranaerophilales bacterium]|nr:efflux transporter outer membrane subunit [Candidatus Gastranaerophilales bacterium]
MNKQKLLILFLAASLFTATNITFSAETKKQVNKEVKQLKGSVADYRAEFINRDWWSRFDDPVLSDYIFKAANANHDLKIATLRVSETKATVQDYLGKEFPTLNLGGNFQREKTSDNVSMGSFKLNEYSQSKFNFPLTMNYELDLWLKNRKKTLGAAKELEAVKYDERAAFISLTSTVAAVYFNILRTDKLIELQKQILDLRNNQFDLIKVKNAYGLCPVSDIIQSEKTLTDAQTGLTELEKQQGIFLNQLAVLIGESVNNASSLKRSSLDDLDLIKDLPTDIKSDIVQKRPDILKAEALLQKSKIDVDLARKDFLPNINITGQYGFFANSLSKTINSNSYIASIGAGLVQTIFSGGQRFARLKVRKFKYEQMIENYQKIILQSFQEINDSLASLKADTSKNNNNISRVNLEQRNLDLINIKYETGAISYLDTLEYKTRVISLEKEQAQSKTDCFIDSLSLYKATGGKL